MHVTFEERLFGEESPNIEEFRQKNRFKQVKFAIFLGALQLALLCLFVRFTSYALKADASVAENGISVALGGGAGRTETGQLVKNITLQVRVGKMSLRPEDLWNNLLFINFFADNSDCGLC